MKTLKKIALVLAVVLGVGMLASCEFSTFGMDKITADELTNSTGILPADWVKGTWTGKVAHITYGSDGSIKSNATDDSAELGTAAAYAIMVSACTADALYGDPTRTHVVAKFQLKDNNGKVTDDYRIDLKKKSN